MARVDRKLRDVAVGRYSYRHEAEFAAGFLADAGIPYRLQIDDPAMGLSISSSATLWVAAVDETKARTVLTGHPPDGEAELAVEADDDLGSHAPASAGHRGPLSLADVVRGAPRSAPVDRTAKPDLTLRQRAVATAMALALGASLAMDAVREAVAWLPAGVGLVAGGLLAVALTGRAPDSLKRILAALSGDLS